MGPVAAEGERGAREDRAAAGTAGRGAARLPRVGIRGVYNSDPQRRSKQYLH